MAATLILDTIDESEFDVAVGNINKMRGGLVVGVSGDPSTAIEQVLDCCGAAGFYLGKAATVGTQTVYLQRVTGKAVSADAFRVQLIFTYTAGGTPTAYVITTRGYQQAYQNNRLPGSRIPLRVPSWTDPAHPTNPPVPSDNAMLTFQYSMRELTVSGVKVGTPPANDLYGSAVNTANAETFLGLPPGYWVVSSGGSSESKFSGYYSYNISAVTKNIEDWSEIATLYNSKLNIYVKVDPTVETRVLGRAYAFGTIDSGPGILRVGPFQTGAFLPLFGFTSLTLPTDGNNQSFGGPQTGSNFV